MAHKKAGGSTKNDRESESKRLGIKKYGGDQVLAGNILVRQRGTGNRAGDNVGTGTDYTLFSKVTGRVQFRKKGVEQPTIVSDVSE
jgi:large subunit ribosomal protein L27